MSFCIEASPVAIDSCFFSSDSVSTLFNEEGFEGEKGCMRLMEAGLEARPSPTEAIEDAVDEEEKGICDLNGEDEPRLAKEGCGFCGFDGLKGEAEVSARFEASSLGLTS